MYIQIVTKGNLVISNSEKLHDNRTRKVQVVQPLPSQIVTSFTTRFYHTSLFLVQTVWTSWPLPCTLACPAQAFTRSPSPWTAATRFDQPLHMPKSLAEEERKRVSVKARKDLTPLTHLDLTPPPLSIHPLPLGHALPALASLMRMLLTSSKPKKRGVRE